MRRTREILTMVILAGLSLVSLAATTRVVRQPLPEGSSVDLRQLVDWLATHDVVEEPRSTKLQIIAQMEREFRDGAKWQAKVEQLSPEEMSQFEKNFAELMEVWFLDKVAEFHRCRPENRQRYVDKELRNIMSWPVLTRSESAAGGGKKKRGGLLGELALRIQRVLEDADEQQQQQAQDFLMAVQAQMIQRTLERVQPGG
jgi:ssRNA-specific RNase YbeY (16S rRNA maturation enzyme)